MRRGPGAPRPRHDRETPGAATSPGMPPTRPRPTRTDPDRDSRRDRIRAQDPAAASRGDRPGFGHAAGQRLRTAAAAGVRCGAAPRREPARRGPGPPERIPRASARPADRHGARTSRRGGARLPSARALGRGRGESVTSDPGPGHRRHDRCRPAQVAWRGRCGSRDRAHSPAGRHPCCGSSGPNGTRRGPGAPARRGSISP